MATARDRLLLTLATLVALAVAGAAGWFLWLPGHRPELRSGERYGIDVSHHQGRIDWRRVADDGISFAYIKASEGSSFIDPLFDANWSGAGGAGIERGAYHFFSLCSPGASQAANFLRVVPKRLELPPAVDLELSPHCSAGPTAGELRAEVKTFLRLVERSFRAEAILYVSDDFEDAYPVVAAIERPRWRLRFLLRPDIAWRIWQVGSYADVDGISGPVGLDVLSR